MELRSFVLPFLSLAALACILGCSSLQSQPTVPIIDLNIAHEYDDLKPFVGKVVTFRGVAATLGGDVFATIASDDKAVRLDVVLDGENAWANKIEGRRIEATGKLFWEDSGGSIPDSPYNLKKISPHYVIRNAKWHLLEE